jgi:tetratricopeptide (TPR) repeat protein
MGNQLALETLQAMAATFEATKGTLAERLLAALVAGDKAGGQINGKQSAALLVKGTENEWFNQIDLRVDHSADPFGDLQRLLHYHFGRIVINRATAAINRKDSALGRNLLAKGIELTKGWYGMYSRIAKAYLLLGEEKAAVRIIRQALAAEPRWYKNLPAFYSLYHHSSIRKAYPVSAFTEADWNVATSMFIDLKRYDEALASTQKIRLLFPNSCQNFFLQAKALSLLGDKDAAKVALKEVLKLEPEHPDATRLARIIGY